MNNKQKGFVLPIIITIVALLVLGGGAYIYVNKKPANNPKINFPDIVNNVPISTTTINITGDWKVYTNTQYGFEVKYPSDWKIADKSMTDSTINTKYPSVNIESPLRYDLPGYINIATSYRILIYRPEAEIISIADFGSNEKPAQSWWNTNVTKATKEATDEYKVGQQIISSFKFISLPNNIVEYPNSPVITYVSSVKSTPDVANGKITSGSHVYLTGKNLVGCTSINNCETAVYIADKMATVDVSSYVSPTSLAFTAPVLASGNYDLYLVNLVTGQKSNVVKVTVDSTQPSITILSPNGGESYKVGSRQDIKWNAPATLKTVRIFLESVSTHYVGGGVGGYIPDVHIILAQDALNSGSYTTNIPDVATGKYSVLIEGIDNSGKPVVLSDSSDSYFIIK